MAGFVIAASQLTHMGGDPLLSGTASGPAVEGEGSVREGVCAATVDTHHPSYVGGSVVNP